jgi:hypothetical protein
MANDSTGQVLRHIATGVTGTVKSDDGFGQLDVQLETGPRVKTEAPQWQGTDKED